MSETTDSAPLASSDGVASGEQGKDKDKTQDTESADREASEPSLEEGLAWVEFLRWQSPSAADKDSNGDAASRKEQACRGLGKLAGRGVETRDRVLSWGTLDLLLQVLSESSDEAHTSACKGATWAVAQLCRGKPSVKLETIEAAVPVLVSLLNHRDESVRVDAAWGLSYIGDCGGARTDRILAHRPIPLLVALLESKSPLPAARAIGDVVAGSDDEMTQAVIDAGALPKFRPLLCHPEEAVRKEVCWLLSNVLAGTVAQIQAVIDADLLPPLLESLHANEASVRKEAVWAATQLNDCGTEEQRQYFLFAGGLTSLCKCIIGAGEEADRKGGNEKKIVELAQTAAGLCLQKDGCCAGELDATLVKYLGPSLSKKVVDKVIDKVRRSTAIAWCDCGKRTPTAGNVTVAKESYSAQQCYVRALEIDPMQHYAWTWLGTTVSGSGSVAVRGESYSAQQCYVRALEVDPLYSRSWINLGTTVSGSGSVAVRGESYSAQQCYVRALEIDPMEHYAWTWLGTTVSGSGSVAIRGESYTMQHCYVRALEIDPMHSHAWHNLGNTLPDGGHIRVKGRFYTKRQCFLLSLSPLSSVPSAPWTDQRIAILNRLS